MAIDPMQLQPITASQQAHVTLPDLEHLWKIISTVPDGAYCVTRYVYLIEWKYYILETRRFKVRITESREPDAFKLLENFPLGGRTLWVVIDGTRYHLSTHDGKYTWDNSVSVKAAQFKLEQDVEDITLTGRSQLQQTLPF